MAWLAITQADWLLRVQNALFQTAHFWIPAAWQRKDLASGDRWYFREQVWNKSMGRPPQILGHGTVVRYERTTPRKLFNNYGTDSGYGSAADLAIGIDTTGYSEQGSVDRQIGNIVLSEVVIYKEPVTAPRSIPSTNLVTPNGRSYWPFSDEILLPLLPEMTTRVKATDADIDYDPASLEDARERVFRAIKVRRGQKGFREALLVAYERRCAITGCAVLDVLEAAHIAPYLGRETNHVTNGLLLRADLHTLYDCGLMAIHPETLKIAIAPSLATSSYRKINDRPLRMPTSASTAPNKKALAKHFTDFQERHFRT
jgi:hypothetical protein